MAYWPLRLWLQFCRCRQQKVVSSAFFPLGKKTKVQAKCCWSIPHVESEESWLSKALIVNVDKRAQFPSQCWFERTCMLIEAQDFPLLLALWTLEHQIWAMLAPSLNFVAPSEFASACAQPNLFHRSEFEIGQEASSASSKLQSKDTCQNGTSHTR